MHQNAYILLVNRSHAAVSAVMGEQKVENEEEASEISLLGSQRDRRVDGG